MKSADIGLALVRAVTYPKPEDRVDQVLKLLDEIRAFRTVIMANAVYREAHRALLDLENG